MDKLIYFDYAATTPVRREAADALLDALGRFGNPSSRYEYARQAAQRVKEDREAIAGIIAETGLPPAVRGEELGLEALSLLADRLYEALHS